jgi:DNA polymerase III alpha subunit
VFRRPSCAAAWRPLAAAEAEFKWWLDLFGEDYYVELQRHGIPEQDRVNAVLVQWARKYNVPIIASNDSHYTDPRGQQRARHPAVHQHRREAEHAHRLG